MEAGQQSGVYNERKLFLTGAIKTFDKVLLTIEESILAFGIISIAFFMVGNVISRNVFNYTWIFVDEYCQGILISQAFIGLGYAARKGRHIRMSAAYDLLPKGIRKVVIIMISFVTAFVMFLLCYFAIRYAIAVKRMDPIMPSLGIPYYLVIMWVPFGFAIAGIEYGMAIHKNLVSKDAVYISSEADDSYAA